MKRTELKRKTGLPAKRAKPRRNEGRIQHGRTKRPRVSKTAEEARHLQRVAGMVCCITGKLPVEVHHLMKAPGKRTRRDHRWVVPLHYLMHRGPHGVHGLGSEARFEEVHDLHDGYLVALARAYWNDTEREEGRP